MTNLLRIYDTQKRKHYIVASDGAVYANGADRLIRKSGVADPNVDPIAEMNAAARFFDEYFVAPFSGIAANNGRFVSRGRVNAAEARRFDEGEAIRGRRSALEEHLDYFDQSPADGVITLRENFKGWRALGYGRVAAAWQALLSGLVFGGIGNCLAIEIAGIGERRSGSENRTRIYDDAGEVDEAWLQLFLDDFDKAAQAARTSAIPQEEALEIVQRYAKPGLVSRGQFRSLFKVCTRLNDGKTITRQQFRALFEGSLLVMAASFPARDGHAGIETLLSKD